MLSHTRPEIDSGLTDVLSIGAAAAILLVDPFRIEFVRTSLIAAKEKTTKFDSGLCMKINVVAEKRSFKVLVKRSDVGHRYEGEAFFTS